MGRNARVDERFAQRPAEFRDFGVEFGIRGNISVRGQQTCGHLDIRRGKNFHGGKSGLRRTVLVLGVLLLRAGAAHVAGSVRAQLSLAADDRFVFVPRARRKTHAAKTFGSRLEFRRRRTCHARHLVDGKFFGGQIRGRVGLHRRGGLLRIVFRAQQKNSARTKIRNDDNLVDDGNLFVRGGIFFGAVDVTERGATFRPAVARRAH